MEYADCSTLNDNIVFAARVPPCWLSKEGHLDDACARVVDHVFWVVSFLQRKLAALLSAPSS